MLRGTIVGNPGNTVGRVASSSFGGGSSGSGGGSGGGGSSGTGPDGPSGGGLGPGDDGDGGLDGGDVSPIPIPAGLPLLGTALAALLIARRKRLALATVKA